jgi:cathepsin L
MQYVEKHSQELESQYRYTARTGTCKAKTGSVSVKGIANVRAGGSSSLKAAIAKGPTSVTVEADRSVFQRYKSGVLNSSQCGTQLDHAITAVGYGTSGGQEYYIVRNSWGTSWGDRGYINIAATSSGKGICGIQQVSVWPTTN